MKVDSWRYIIPKYRFLRIFPEFIMLFSVVFFYGWIISETVFYDKASVSLRFGVIEEARCIKGSRGAVTFEIVDSNLFSFNVNGYCKKIDINSLRGMNYTAAFLPGFFGEDGDKQVLVELSIGNDLIVTRSKSAFYSSLAFANFTIFPAIFLFLCFPYWRQRTFYDLIREKLGEDKVDEGVTYKRPALERMRHLVRTDPRWKRDFERCVEIERENRKALNQIKGGNEALLATLEQRISAEGYAVFSSSDIYGRKEMVTVIRKDSRYRLAISYNDQPPAEEDFATLKDAIEHMHEICMSRLDGYKSGVKRTL